MKRILAIAAALLLVAGVATTVIVHVANSHASGTPSSLVAYWPADSGGLDTVGGIQGVLENGAALVPGINAAGNTADQAFGLDGVNADVSLTNPTAVLNLSSAIAVSAWLKPAAQTNSQGGWYFSRRDPLVSESFSAAIMQDNSIEVIVRAGLLGPNGEYFHSAAGAVTVGQWQNVVVTAASGDTVRAYVNGTPVAMSPVGATDSATLGGPLFTVYHVWFGQRQYSNAGEGTTGGAHFAGSIDDVRVFNSTDILAPTINIDSPTASSYPHDGSLSISYGVNDGTGVGAQSSSASIDSTLTVTSGQVLNLLTSLGLGSHTLTVNALDYLGRTTSQSVTFTVVATPASITDDVNQFVSSGQISDPGIAQSLLAKLAAAQRARTNGDCNTAGNIYQALISELQAQSGIGVDPTAASIMTADAQYLIAHCP